MGKQMTRRIPDTDSIQELARFWDSNDLTDFEDDLEEETESVFELDTAVRIQLTSEEIEALNQIARSSGVDPNELLRGWILEKIHPS
jgi:hypothetical protein